MDTENNFTSEPLDHKQAEADFRLVFLLPDSQPAHEVQLQDSIEVGGCTNTNMKEDILSWDSPLRDTQHQDSTSTQDPTSPGLDAVTEPLSCFGTPLSEAKHANELPAKCQNVGEDANYSSQTDTRASKNGMSIKLYFPVSKPSTGHDRNPADSYHLSPTAPPLLDDDLPDTQPSSPTLPCADQTNLANQPNLLFTSSSSHAEEEFLCPETSPFSLDSTLRLDSHLSTSVTEILGKQSYLGTILQSPRKIPDTSASSVPPISLSSSQRKAFDENLPDTQCCAQHQNSPTQNTSTPSLLVSQVSVSTTSDAKIPVNKVSCRERKRIIVSPNRPPNVTKAMIEWVQKTNWLLDPFREDDDCWFHPSPPPARLSVSGILRPIGKLQKRFAWKDKHEKHSLVLNYGIVVKLINYRMTKQQQDGFVNKQWHLSHLCGNWTCLNPAHTTVESGLINISRNNCFSHRSGCFHTPNCLKDKKVALGSDGKLVDHSEMAVRGVLPLVDEWDNWTSPVLVDDDDSMLDDFNDLESLDPEDCDKTPCTPTDLRDGTLGHSLDSTARAPGDAILA